MSFFRSHSISCEFFFSFIFLRSHQQRISCQLYFSLFCVCCLRILLFYRILHLTLLIVCVLRKCLWWKHFFNSIIAIIGHLIIAITALSHTLFNSLNRLYMHKVQLLMKCIKSQIWERKKMRKQKFKSKMACILCFDAQLIPYSLPIECAADTINEQNLINAMQPKAKMICVCVCEYGSDKFRLANRSLP